MLIGILSLQGDFDRHQSMLRAVGVETCLVREQKALEKLDGLVLPGGESTTMGKLIQRFDLAETLDRRIKGEGMPVFATCAGMILLAQRIEGYRQYSIGALDMTINRNAYGRQIESFEADIRISAPERRGLPPSIRGVFIRAPRISELGPDIEVLAEFEDSPVLIRRKNILATSFHPELTDDPSIHSFFCQIVESVIQRKT